MMTNKQLHFIVKTFDTISKMPAKYDGCSFNDFSVAFDIKGNNVITKIEGKEYTDTLPLKGSRRDRNALADMVCNHICEAWGGSMEEVADYNLRFLREFAAVMNEFKEKLNK